MHESFYTIGNLGKHYPEDEPSPIIAPTASPTTTPAIDLAFIHTLEMQPGSNMSFVWEQGHDAPIVSGSYPDALEFDHQSNFYFHPQTGGLLVKHLYEDKSFGLQLQEMSYGLHTGQYLGLTGKILAFVGSLFVATLPVTGFVVWWGRRNKSGRRRLNELN
ncbi:PepSY domain-containing protein [Antarcticibacterium sp. 1MA-6-2]|uniref:PepSY-associated TM helix domain-containing protein n=1 Tax=Antarcticibacterium sp. 1MA-6-2 TaxID=2908210 RepID=UPI002105F708|nr:PepSY-associated TM helix domain-containing protein [Antarcticibacterium sp. 1MA-6-2]